MRLIKWLVIISIGAVLGFAQSRETATASEKKLTKLAYEDGNLINVGEEPILKSEIISPFYKYLGDIAKGEKINVNYIRTKFTVQYLLPSGLAEYEQIKQTFIPIFKEAVPDIGLDITSSLKGERLYVKVSSKKDISNVNIEILPDIPIRISHDRIRYIISSVGVEGQNIAFSHEADFGIILLQDKEIYKIPIQIHYKFAGLDYKKLIFYTFRKEAITDAVRDDELHRQSGRRAEEDD